MGHQVRRRRPQARVATWIAAVVATIAACGSSGPAAMTGRQGMIFRPRCSVPALPGTHVSVRLMDMGRNTGMRMPRHMRLVAVPAAVTAGKVSFVAVNAGFRSHELVVLPLAAGQPAGARVIRSDRTVDESGSLGEASATCTAARGTAASPPVRPGG